jgi:4,5:9,10-diseco-3-hydroxy-5,9,17-trioxoandrosta-1(10),2-diene-4-oate hydrolase
MIPEGQYIDVQDGFRFHYYDEGEGEVVVLLHGSGTGASGHTNFKKNFIALKNAGFRVILPDLPGYGFPSRPDNVVYSMDYFNQKIIELLDILDVHKFSLIGNSLGGALSIGLGLNHVERVQKLILMAPGGVEDREMYNEMPGIKKLMSDFLGGDMNQEKIEGLLALFPYDASIVTDEMVQERMEILPLMNSQVLATMAIPNMEEQLHLLHQPVLAFWGMNDQFIPVSGAMKIGEHCPNAQVMLFSQCGHWVMIEQEEVFNSACINFLKN